MPIDVGEPNKEAKMLATDVPSSQSSEIHRQLVVSFCLSGIRYPVISL